VLDIYILNHPTHPSIPSIHPSIHPSIDHNSYFQLSNTRDGLAMGGGGAFALLIDPELLNVRRGVWGCGLVGVVMMGVRGVMMGVRGFSHCASHNQRNRCNHLKQSKQPTQSTQN
jgi:hypothetical protein